MSELILECSRDEARKRVIAALERTDGISKIQESEYQVVGETGLSFPRVLWSWGEKVYVDLGDLPTDGRTRVTVRGEKNVPINIGADPQQFKRRFIAELEGARSTETEVEGNEGTAEVSQADYNSGYRSVQDSNESDNKKGKAVGLTLFVIGIFALSLGAPMSPTVTNSAETCVNDPTGFGEDCYGASVTVNNLMKDVLLGSGTLSLLSGSGIYIFGLIHSREKKSGQSG